MSFRTDYYKYAESIDYTNSDFSNGFHFEEKSEKEIKSLFHEILNQGMHGLCFSMYEEGQRPGDIISEEQVRRRLQIIAPYTKWVRSFSCTEGNEFIPKIARNLELKH